LEDILASCEKILEYVGEMTMDQFMKDDKTYDAVVRNLEIIGEAAKKIPGSIAISIPKLSGDKWPGCVICSHTIILVSIMIFYGM
jgi:uncharacterized protein with HEPN domain